MSAWWVTSRPIIVMSMPLSKTRLRGLGVGPDVELGRGRAVALADRAAHQHDPLGPRVGLEREQQRDVRQRAGRDERDRALARADRSRQEVDRVLATGAAARRRQVGAVEPALAVHVGGDRALAHERGGGAGRDRDVASAGELEHAQRVGGRLLDRLVPATVVTPRRSTSGEAEREQDRDRVVVAGVAVEDDRRRRSRSSPARSARASVGREALRPERRGREAPAAHARRSASS